jgi:membrane protein DedA with SNARE-associated domain
LEAIAESLIQHGYWILFAWVFLDQLALPVPALPMILAAGALSGAGHLDPFVCAAVVVLASTPADAFWYWLGIRQGNKVLTLLCAISIEPDSCVSNTTSLFHRYGTASLLLAKFVPGLQTVAPPLAGLLGVRPARFLALNAAGSLLYAVVFLAPGYWAHEWIFQIGRVVAEFGSVGFAVIAGVAIAWLAWKVVHRQRFLRNLRGRRIAPEDLLASFQGPEPMQVADLRQRLEFNAFPKTIPGAVRVPLDIFDEEVERLSLERPLVLFCT